jgi:hypothetical protein
LKQEHRLKVVNNREVKMIFGPMMEGATAGWRRLHNDRLHAPYSS